jgi:hypothetical protein
MKIVNLSLVLAVTVAQLADAEILVSPSPWKAVTDKSILLKTLPKPKPKVGEPITADQLDEHLLYSCKVNESDREDVSSAEMQSKYATLPRIAFFGPNHFVVWVCTDEENLKTISPGHYRAISNFAIYSRAAQGKRRLVATQGEMAVLPTDIVLSDRGIEFTESFHLSKAGKETYTPYTTQYINCGAKVCSLSPVKCVLKRASSDMHDIVARFDKAVDRYKKQKNPPGLDESEPFQLLDELFVLAATGDHEAQLRFQHFPFEVDAGPAAILGEYTELLRRSKKLGCSQSD